MSSCYVALCIEHTVYSRKNCVGLNNATSSATRLGMVLTVECLTYLHCISNVPLAACRSINGHVHNDVLTVENYSIEK